MFESPTEPTETEPRATGLCRLLGPDEPPAVHWFHRDGRSPVLILCDHALPLVPESLGRLGLEPDHFTRHIAYDIGAAEVTRHLARRLDAPAILGGYSRLVVDLNRGLSEASLIPEISDRVVIPGNLDLTPAAREARLEALFYPYHQAIAAAIADFRTRGIVPAIIAVHSFTPAMEGVARPWQIGILWDHDPRIPEPLIEALKRRPGLIVGDNLPYTGRDTDGGSIESHATPAGLPNVLLEFRQDLIETPEAAAEWADLLADRLIPILADPELYRVQLYPRPPAPAPSLCAGG